jgi:hypothetical protein
VFASDPAVVVQEGRRIGLAATTSLGEVYYNYSINDSWAGWQSMGNAGGFVNQAPTLLARNGNYVDIFCVRSDGAAYPKHWDGANYHPSLTGWELIGASLGGRLSVASWGP